MINELSLFQYKGSFKSVMKKNFFTHVKVAN